MFYLNKIPKTLLPWCLCLFFVYPLACTTTGTANKGKDKISLTKKIKKNKKAKVDPDLNLSEATDDYSIYSDDTLDQLDRKLIEKGYESSPYMSTAWSE